ncbi:hypothetical protein HDV06_004044 [Boothiomyces sp. JEL0866]|nr:hypothetical protein HDV06_004044 [Boothiomyces sp. JEL0866]
MENISLQNYESPYLALCQQFQVNLDIALESALPGDLPSINGIPEETLDQLSEFNSMQQVHYYENGYPSLSDINGYASNITLSDANGYSVMSDTNSIAEELFSTDDAFQVPLVRSDSLSSQPLVRSDSLSSQPLIRTDSLSSQLTRTSSISKINRSKSLTRKPELKRSNSQKRPELERSKSLKSNWKLNKTSDGYKCPLLKDHLHKEDLEFTVCGEKRSQAKEMKNHLLLGHGVKANIRGDVILF